MTRIHHLGTMCKSSHYTYNHIVTPRLCVHIELPEISIALHSHKLNVLFPFVKLL